MPHRASIILAIALLAVCTRASSHAGDAVFSADGKQIYVIAQVQENKSATRVHYVINGKHWLVTNGKTEELRLTTK